ncbi:hypothetical protein [Staphylococcus phage vB_SauH_DELF3]|nr:hypothetical protein [Staphylococcus phage vB_SauH_DELF3]
MIKVTDDEHDLRLNVMDTSSYTYWCDTAPGPDFLAWLTVLNRTHYPLTGESIRISSVGTQYIKPCEKEDPFEYVLKRDIQDERI